MSADPRPVRPWRAIRQRLLTLLPILRQAGVDPFRSWTFLRGFPGFLRDLRDFGHLDRELGHPLLAGRITPVIGDNGDSAGVASGHYFHQDLLVAQRIFELKPRRHIDVGSRIDGFVAHVASFRPIEVVDIRPLGAEIPNVTFRQADLMCAPGDLVGSTDSLSSLHAIEHFGLGRYGDPLNPQGHVRAIESLAWILEQGGLLHASFPIGPTRLEFNAQRVFSLEVALHLFSPFFRLERFSFVRDDGTLSANVSVTEELIRTNAGCNYGCGIFELRRV